MSKEHAEHNEAACDFLAADGQWDDWVVTTAFYAAVHFVEFKMFPMKDGEKEFKTFELYYEDTKSSSSAGFHKRRKRLVQTKIPEAYPGYKYLMDQARIARYKNYQVGERIADLAREHLKTIKAHCLN